ncbi:hypothetical protein [Haloplanus aerogenes]|uniref:Uncharacterized protein n=1 Tax=Haloplanus aerogenes TaxID=660522 RepID=A0A3M0DWI1_9EURY|nr:hypothetical protein [Haloplanus aerogenes]AZH24347.1 hypothetical protein DU502_02675 [Haloplanus aerogenes]RMB24019.1 hypothetical protein ATH50_1252 [Haloplanus aerogenes]
MAFELGFLVGSLVLLGVVLYFTRIRGPSLPHEAMAEGEGGTPDGDRDRNREGGARPRAEPTRAVGARVELCELCGENPASKTVNEMTVCAECDEDLLA